MLLFSTEWNLCIQYTETKEREKNRSYKGKLYSKQICYIHCSSFCTKIIRIKTKQYAYRKKPESKIKIFIINCTICNGFRLEIWIAEFLYDRTSFYHYPMLRFPLFLKIMNRKWINTFSRQLLLRFIPFLFDKFINFIIRMFNSLCGIYLFIILAWKGFVFFFLIWQSHNTFCPLPSENASGKFYGFCIYLDFDI